MSKGASAKADRATRASTEPASSLGHTASVPSAWQPVETHDGSRWPHVDLWMSWGASPLTMGMADAFRVADCWFDDGEWWHEHSGKPSQLNGEYITHWLPRPLGPNGEEWS